MKKIVLILAASLLTLSSAQAQKAGSIQSLAIGSSVPLADKEFASVNRKSVSLEKMRTRNGLLVMFSCNTCPYVIKAQGRTKEMMAYAAEKGIGLVIVNSNEAQRTKEDAPDAMKQYAEKQGYRAPYVIDDKSVLADAFGATRTPEVYLFDGSGKLVYKGAMEDNPSDPSASKEMFLRSAIDNMLSRKPIEPNSTRSIGCSIKRAM